MKSIVGTLVGGLFGLIFSAIGGGIVFFIGLPVINTAKESESWPQVSGVIISSEVIKRRGDDIGDSPSYSSDVSYDYTVDETKYTAEVVYWGDEVSTNSRSRASNTVNKYPKGKEVAVYYSPDDPSVAVLEPGTTWSSYFFIMFGGVFLLFGSIALLATIGPLLFGLLAVSGGAFAFFGSKSGSNDRFSIDEKYPTKSSGQSDYSSSGESALTSQNHDEDDGFDI